MAQPRRAAVVALPQPRDIQLGRRRRRAHPEQARAGIANRLHFSKFLGRSPWCSSVACVDDVPNEVGLDLEFDGREGPECSWTSPSGHGATSPSTSWARHPFADLRTLCDWWPAFSDMQVAFIGKPNIDLDLRLIGDIAKFPVVDASSRPHQERLTKLMALPPGPTEHRGSGREVHGPGGQRARHRPQRREHEPGLRAGRQRVQHQGDPRGGDCRDRRRVRSSEDDESDFVVATLRRGSRVGGDVRGFRPRRAAHRAQNVRRGHRRHRGAVVRVGQTRDVHVE